MEILWKGIVSTYHKSPECLKYAFPQNFHIRKSGEIMVFFAVSSVSMNPELFISAPLHEKLRLRSSKESKCPVVQTESVQLSKVQASRVQLFQYANHKTYQFLFYNYKRNASGFKNGQILTFSRLPSKNCQIMIFSRIIF